MSSISRSYLILLVLLGLSSCLQEDSFSLSELDPYFDKIVVNSILTNDQQVEVQVSNSTATVDTTYPQFLSNAEVILSQNGVSTTLTYDPFSKTYKGPVIPKEDDKFLLTVQSTGLVPVSANAAIPRSFQATAELVPEGGLDTSGIPSDLLRINFTDDPDADNFYKLNFYYYFTTLGAYVPMVFNITDPDLAEFNGVRQADGSMVFSDIHFNGEAKSLSTVAPFGLVISNPDEKYLITLESLSEDLFRYYSSIKDANDAQGGDFVNAFNEAVVIHSNVSRGLGILGATYRSEHPLK